MERHHHHYRGRGRGFGPRGMFRGRFPSRPELIERLEAFQRDLEEQAADVADVLAHLRDSAENAPQQQG
jgi:hypothetical protein